MQQKQSMKEFLEKSKADRASKARGNAVTMQSGKQEAANDNGLAEHQPPKKKPFDLKQRIKEDRERKERRALALANIEQMPLQDNSHASNNDSEVAVPPADDEGDDAANDNQPEAHATDDKRIEIALRPAIATGIKPEKSKTMKELLTEMRERDQRFAIRKAMVEKSQEANPAQEDEQADDGQPLPQADDKQQSTDDGCPAEPQPPKEAKISMRTLVQEDMERQEWSALARAAINKIQAQEDEQADDGASEIAPPPANDEVDAEASVKQSLTHAACQKTQEIAHRPAIATGIVPGHKKPYPVHAFGSMAAVVTLIAKAVQVSAEMVGSSLLGVLAALVQAVINVAAKASGIGCPVSINMLIIASSGERKSSTSRARVWPSQSLSIRRSAMLLIAAAK